jgi:hypothetical protein
MGDQVKRWILVACVGLVACAGILGYKQQARDVFPHRVHVVKGISCMRCHATVGKPGVRLNLPDEATCQGSGCHDKPQVISTVAVARIIEAQQYIKFDHAKHLGVTNNNCMRCHAGVGESDANIRPPMATCFKCHVDEQRGRKCGACHTSLVEEGALPATHLAHDGDWLREHGTRASSSGDLCETCHKESFCASCHGVNVPALPAERKFSDPFRASVHRAGFVARHALEARSDPGACTTCHQPSSCLGCHTSKNVANNVNGSPHPAGWVGLASADNRHGREARRDPAACASCHGGAGEKLCVSCHAVGGVGGNPHPPGWSSNQPLSAMPCRMCHPIGAPR